MASTTEFSRSECCKALLFVSFQLMIGDINMRQCVARGLRIMDKCNMDSDDLEKTCQVEFDSLMQWAKDYKRDERIDDSSDSSEVPLSEMWWQAHTTTR
ncbi:hypothetical protein GQ54DRAFT_297981 [Martensiomyces pterosporus]|nr:hypothetical protein GQ54DRAFT_297981 [Martensiomyces pterosporus]